MMQPDLALIDFLLSSNINMMVIEFYSIDNSRWDIYRAFFTWIVET